MTTTESINTDVLPLAGLRVVEIGSSVAAPYATWILAALGADVIKIERPGSGDDARQWGELFADGTSSIFHALNRDKRSVAVDLKDPQARQRLQDRLLSRCDVILQNLRPGVITGYGLDADTLCATNERLIYCNIWAFGATGPLRNKPGYDPLMQAYGGIMSVTGEPGREPVRVGTSIIDMGTGMWCAIGILAA
jgi:crotonobetainyl-CoA:carnitine CoA-transferase CaiB-like acyl-CoA transferase